MPANKLTIVPVTLDPITEEIFIFNSPQISFWPVASLKQLMLKFPSSMA